MSEGVDLPPAAFLRVEAWPRYFEDAVVDGIQADDDTPTPGREGDCWRVTINLSAGRIVDWPKGRTLRTHYKVCDGGIYALLDAAGEVLATRSGYVPGRYLCQKSGGLGGDYIVLDIGPDGAIADWHQPSDDGEGWTPTHPSRP